MTSVAEPNQKIRLDKWIWFARIAKTRTIAKKLVLAGKIRIDGVKTSSPSITVRPENTLTITQPRRILVYRIISIGTRRGPASEAQILYEDLSPPVIRQTPVNRPAKQAVRDEGAGRPTKRERRKMAEFRLKAGEEF